MNMYRLGIAIVLLGTIYMVSGDGRDYPQAIVRIKYQKFDSKGKDKDNQPCDDETIDNEKCDPKFVFCVDKYNAGGGTGSNDCHYNRKRSDKYKNKDVVRFRGNIKGVDNPVDAKVENYKGVYIKVEAIDDDGNIPLNSDDDIDKFKYKYYQRADRNEEEAQRTSVAIRGERSRGVRAELEFDVWVFCDTHSYGDNCTIFCKGVDENGEGHYGCNARGEKYCLDGWEDIDRDCLVWENNCQGHGCVHGQCHDLYNDYECVCDDGYSGFFCEREINECLNVECRNGGTCVDLINDFRCECEEFFSGIWCQNDACNYPAVYCENNGTCHHNPGGSLSCTCPEGYSGDRCEVDLQLNLFMQITSQQSNQITALRNSVESLESNLARMQSQTTSYDTDIDALRSQTSGIGSDVTILEARMENAETDISGLQTQLEQHASSLDTLDTSVTSQGTAIATLQTTTDDHETRIGDLEQTVETNYNRFRTVETSLTIARSRIENLEEASQASANAVADVQTRMDTFESDLGTIQSRTTTVEGNITTLSTQIEANGNRMDTLDIQLDSVEAQISEINSRLDANEANTTALHTRIGTVETQLTGLQTQFSTLSDTVTSQASALQLLAQSFEDSMVTVAFYAYSTSSQNCDNGNTIRFQETETNIGNHFGSHKFTVPYNGTYLLIHQAHAASNKKVRTVLKVGDNVVGSAFATGGSGGVQGDATVTIVKELFEGEVVKVECNQDGSQIHGSGSKKWSNFGGFLLRRN